MGCRLKDFAVLGIGSLCTHEALTCWKCAYIIQQYNKDKLCPICKNSLKVVKYIDFQSYDPDTVEDISFIQMSDKEMMNMNKEKVEDESQIQALYESEAVKNYIFHWTAPYCYECDKVFRMYVEYKRHIETLHGQFICELCLKNRHCVLADIEVYNSKAELKKHLDGKSEDSNLKHEKCSFCLNYHDDAVALKKHYRDEHRICEFCQNPYKKDTDYVFADYKGFMTHAKQFHLICGHGGWDCVFKDVTSLDIHQADIHKKKITLRIQHKEDEEGEEETK